MSTPEAPSRGPCVQWISAADVAATCDALDSSGDPSVYDDAAQAASDLLFELSGRQFSGLCERTVRPCESRACRPPDPCGCCFVSKIRLAGFPVRDVSEVKIDGATIDASGYRLDSNRWLVRLADEDGRAQRWPGCQRLDLDDTEDGTFSVAYSYGADPPLAGTMAAAEFACQVAGYLPAGGCDLPAGVRRVTRQGITIEIDGKPAVIPFGPLVSVFLQTYNPNGNRRPSAIWSPDIEPFPRSVGA